MIDITRLKQVYATLQQGGYNQDFDTFRKGFAGNENYANRKKVYDLLSANGAQIGKTYEEFMQNMQKPKSMGNPTVNKYRQQMFKSVDPTKNKASELTRKAVKTAHKAMDNVRKPVRGAVVNKQGKKVKEFDITPVKTLDDLNREYAQEVASDWEKEQQRQSLYNTTRSLDEVQRKIAERDAQLDEADNGFWTGIRHAAQGMNVTGGMFQQYDDDMRKELIDPKYKQYLVEANYLTQMKKQLIQEEEDAAAPNATKWDRIKHASSSFTSGMVDEAFGSDAFDFGGYNKMRESDVLLRINDRINRGVATDDDRRLLQILKDKEEVESRLDNDAYSFGRGASQSAGFVTDFLITGGGDFGGLGRLGGKMALGLARKTFAKTMTKDLGKRFAAWSLKNLGKTLGEATGAAMTATSVQVGKTAANATQRYLGLDSDDGGLEYDKEGNLRFKGGTDVGTAIAKAIASGTIENYTELLGPHITSMGKRLFGWAGVGLEKITPDALSRFFDKVGSSELFKRIGTFTDEIANSKVLNAGKKSLAKVGVNDMPEEGLEEEAGIILNSLITGDNKFSDLWDKETQYKTWGGVMSMMGAMRAIPIARSAVGTTYSASKNKVEYFKCKHDLTKAETLARQALGDKWTPIKELIDNADNKHIIEVGVNIIRQSDKYSQEQAKAAQKYIGQLLKMRGFNNATMASIRDKNAKGEEQTDADKKDVEVSNAYAEGHEAEGELRHLIQLEYEKRTANLAKRLGLTPEKIEAMNVDSFSSYIGLNSDADFDIFQYKKAKAAYDGVMDNAQNLVDIAGEVAAHRVDNMTNVHDGTIMKAFKKGTESNPDSPVYIISGNIELNDDGSINYTDSDKMIVVYDEETGQREAIGNFMLASVDPNMQNAEEVKAQAIQEAKQKIITEQSNVIDGILAEGSEFTMESNDGSSHNYKIVQVDVQGNCIVSVDGTILPEPLSLDAIQKMYDQSNIARSVKNDQTAQESEQTTQEPEQTQQEYQPIEDKFDYAKITNVNDGKVKSVVVTDEEGNNRFPNAKDVFLIQDKGAMPKFVVMDEEGNLTSYVGKRSDKIHLMGEKTVDEYKKQRQEELQMIAAENANSSMIEENSGAIEGDRGGIEVNDELPPVPDNVTINGDGTYSVDGAVQGGENNAAPAEQTEQTPAMTLEDGTIVPMLEDGNPDFSKLTAEQTAELYDSQFGEDADSVISGWVSDAKKALDKANNMTVKGKNFVEQKAAKEAKEKAIADAQEAYDSAIAIRDAYNSRQLAKVEDDADGRKNLIEKARRKYNRLKSAVKDDAEAVSQLYKDVVGSLLHRLYDGTGIDVTDTIPLTAEEYVASNLGAHSLNYEGTETSKGVKQETGLSREDFAKTQLLAADGKGTTIDDLVHSLWENRPSNLESLNTQDIRNALIGVLTSGFKASEARNYIENLRIAQAENILEEQKKAADNAAFAEENKAESEQQTETAPESEQINDEENEKINEQTNENINAPEQNKFLDKLKEGSETIEVPEDATDEKPLGEQRTDSPFSARKNGKQQTEAERAADVEKNKVDDVGLVDAVIGEKIRKSFERIAKMMGAKIQYQRTDKLGNGWIQETTDADGNVHRTIFITLDSSITEGAQFIFGHEMTHQIKILNPAAYNELTQLVLDTYGSDAFDKAIDETMKRYSDAGFSGRARDYYAEEVVADAVGEMIRDLNLAHTLAMKMSHPLLAAIHEILQKIKMAFYGTEYSDVTKNIIRSIEQAYVKTANGEITNSETGEDVSYSIRQKPEPKKKGIGYKVFVLKDGKLYPPMVANPDGAATPVGVWLDADAAPIAGESKTGRPQVKQGGKGTQGGSGKLAYRPGWHLGVVPYAIQFNRKDAEGNKTLFPKNFVFAEVEYAADVDYQEEARQEGINPSGKYQHSLAGLKHLPTDGFYMYRTNPNPETDPWVITGAMKVNRILTRAEQAELVKNAGREPQQIQDGDIVTDDVVNSINQEIANAPKFSLKVYHGSGADFTEFDFDHMGEGAGSQVFGWGGYVTSSKKIGKSYATLMDNDPSKAYYRIQRSNGTRFAKKYPTLESFLHGDKQIAMNDKFTEQEKIDFYNEMKKLAEPYHNLYEVDIPDDNGSNYMDWDKSLSKNQQDAIREGLEHLGVGIKTLESKGQSLERTGENVYNSTLYIGLTGTEYDLPERTKGISKFLSSVGFTGIKYKAGRNFGGAKKGDTNYVIFKPEDMKIIEHTKFSLRLKSAIEETETNPSDAQKESGNYKKGHIKFGGYDYTIENPKGSTRSGKDANGKEWKVTMHDTYGYIRGKFGKDGDHLDMFINDKADLDNWDGDVFVVDQVNPDGSFDEHKVMYGYDSMDDAKKAYLDNYSDGWQGLGNITGASKDEFDKWLGTSNRKLKPFADYAKVKFSLKDIKPVGIGAFGNIYNQFRGNAKAAIEFLKKVRGGEAVGALHHKDIGDIDLVWGKEGTGHSDGYGLSKLVKYHPEVLDNLQEILNDMRVVSSSKNRVNLESETHKAGVRLTWDGERKSWLLTAFKKETSASDKRTDTAATSLEGDTALSQTEGSAAKIDNSSEISKENGEKFSLKDEKTMFGMHNISIDKLRKAIKQGGFAAPSMGVVDSKNGIYSDYGEITLIPKTEKLAKKTGKNAGTFTADAWTPTYPQVERIMNKQGEKVFNTDMNEKLGDVDNGIYSNIRESWKGYFSSGDVRDGLYWHYLFDKGMNPETIYQIGKYDNDITNEVMRISDNGSKTDYTDEEVAELIQLENKATGEDNDVEAMREKLKARIASAEKKGNHLLAALKKKRLAELEGVENFYIAADFVNDVVRNNRKNGKVDVHDTMSVAKEKVENDKKLSADFPSWLDKKTEEYGVEEMLYNGTTPSGKPKYIPNTIDNAVKLMKKQGVAGGYTAFGSELGVFIAKNSPEVNTLAAMKNAKDKLIPFGDERHNQIKDKITKEFLELSDEIRVGSNNRYAFDDSGVSRMVELTDHKGNEKEYLKKAYNVEVSDEWMDRYNKLLDTIKKDYKVFYFETKFMRPYGLDEFEKAIVPSDTPSDVVDALKKEGIDVRSYERGNAEDRQKVTMDAINSSDNIRFSLKAEKEKIVADAKANGTYMTAPNGEKTKLDAEQWATVRTANFKNWFGDWENDPENASKVVDENGEPLVVYHGTTNDETKSVWNEKTKSYDTSHDPFTVFKREVDGLPNSGLFFNSSEDNAYEYGYNNYAVYLSAKNPLVIDCKGSLYNSIKHDGKTMDTYDWANWAEENGYDGVIFKNIKDGVDYGSMQNTTDDYVAFNSNQIKSAENNNGDFSSGNNDIRFSLKSMMTKPEGWKQANKKAIHIAEAIERDPKFSLKNLDGTLIKAGTYFSGGGLVEEGLKGIIDPVVAVEYDEKISGVYRNNFGQHIVTADVRDVDPRELVKQIDGEVEYFHASPVCKNYSQAKSNHAEVELDKETAASTAEFINAVKPKVVTIENVKGYKDSEAMKTITDALDANGYTWDADVYNAADYGGYTNRERLIVRAVRDGKLPEKPKKMAHKSGWYEAVADIIPTLTEKKNGVAPWMDIRLKADGIDWRNIDKPLYVMGSAYADGKIPHAFADELLPTLRTKSGDVIVMPDGKVYRAMGRVLARVSGVSDDYKMPFSENLSHTIIGNGIPTQLTEHVIAPLLQNTLRPTTPEDGNTKFSLRGSTPYDKQMEEWMEKNHLEKGAVPMEKPIMKEGENIFDYANRIVEWTRNQNLWKTAPKKTGFQDALDKWKADNGLSPDAYPPVRPHRENYLTEIGYTEDLEEYNKKKEIWKSAPKPKDFDLSVDLEDMNKQLRNIRRAVLNQKNYDQRTVKAVSDLVRKMLNIGWGDGLSRGKVGNLLSAAKNATGANDVKKYLDKAMGILADNYLNRLSTAYDNLINTKGARADQSGVIKMGSLDAKGQAFMSEYKKAINMDDKSLNSYIANIEEDSAKNEDNVEMNDYRLAGIQAAIMYKQQIGGNDADISELKRQIDELKNKKDTTKEDKDLLKSLEKKLFENKFDRITMYENLLNNIQRMVKESKGRAKEFREEITEHKNEILHLANLDLEGVDSTYYDTTTAKKKLVNNDLQRAVFSSTYTFEQFLKFFGKKAANGEGRLYNYFTKLNQDALDEEQLYNEMNRNALDEKTKELFGKKKFMKLVGIDGKGMKEMDVEVTDYSNKETGKRTIHLKQGQMLYIYLVNKETDGEMKLRAMGITEEDVAAIEENLDPRVKAMGEWLQDEYLPECQRRYQATHTKYFGAPMKEVENYFPLAINNRARNIREDVNQDSDAMSQLAGTSTGAIVTRRVNVIPLDIENADAFEVAFNHLQEMEEWSAMLPFRQDVNTLLSYTHFRNQVQNMSSVAYGSGKTLWDEFKQTVQIAAGTYKPKVNAGMMDSRIAAAMGGIAVAKISGRLWTAIKQSQSATVFLPECDFTRFVKNGVNPYGSWKWAKENIPDFRKRIENITYGDVKLRQYLDELEKYHDWTKVISKWGMAPNILVDGITCAVGARSVYETEVNRLAKLGYPKEKAEEKAYYKAVAAYNKTQQSSGGMYLSPMQVDRTYVSAALSLFKNANYAYGRMQIEACRGLARTYDFWGGKHKTTLIESMTRQIMEEDGLDENTARAIAKATYNRTFRQNIGRLINFATLVPVSWALYKVLPYLLTGDDDDKKNDMIEEAVLKGFATSLSDNYVIPFASNILNAGLKVEDGKPTFDPEVFRYQNLYINPATSDLANIYSMIGNQKWYSVCNKVGMLAVQSLIGFNPETVGALYQAFAEADYDNGNTAKEWQIGILKAISAPEESIRELYMDELGLKSGDKDAMKKFMSLAGLDADDINKVPLAELEKRYAERQINRDNLLSQVFMDVETFNGYVEKYQKSFEKKIKDKMDKWDEYDKKKADEFFDTTSDPKLKDMIAKKRAKDANAADEQIAKEGLNQEKKGKEPSEEAYDAVKMSIDVAEDNAISTYNKVLNKRYAAMNDEYNNQTDAMKYIFMSKHPNFKAYKDLKSEYTTYGKKLKELKEKLVSADGYDAKQTILKQIRAERDKFYELQSKVR